MATAAAGGNDRLGDTLMRDGLLSREQLTQALLEQKASKQRLGFVLVKLCLVPELEITKILARQFRMLLQIVARVVLALADAFAVVAVPGT